MLRRFVAVWLVALIVTPFTAPFSTCDLTGLLGTVPNQHHPVRPPVSGGVRNDVAVLTAPALSSAGRVRPPAFSGATSVRAAINGPRVPVGRSFASPHSLQTHTILTTVLRV